MNKKEVEDLIYDYHWMKSEVYRLYRRLFGGSLFPSRSVGVAQYGIEATLPKGSPLKSYAELEAMDAREERQYKRLKYLEAKVKAIEKIPDYLSDDIQLVILDCMMDGMSYRAIAAHLGMNREKVREIKDKMLCQICQNCHFLHDLKKRKTAS
jgi:hypothetical protein